MRLTDSQAATMPRLPRQLAGDEARFHVFGSRVNDNRRGRDLDLMLEFPAPAENPALLAARLPAKASRIVNVRKVDVVSSAPD